MIWRTNSWPCGRLLRRHVSASTTHVAEVGGWSCEHRPLCSLVAHFFTSTTHVVEVGNGGWKPPCPKAQSYGRARAVRIKVECFLGGGWHCSPKAHSFVSATLASTIHIVETSTSSSEESVEYQGAQSFVHCVQVISSFWDCFGMHASRRPPLQIERLHLRPAVVSLASAIYISCFGDSCLLRQFISSKSAMLG